jgi:hypothetical protein
MDVGTDLSPATTDLLADEHISSFLLSIRRRADGEVAGLVLEAAPSDTRTGGAAYPTPGVAAPVIAADSDTDIDVGTAGGLLPDVVDFDPTSAWGGGDEVTATIPVFGAAAAPAGASQPPTLANTGVDIGAVATSSATAARKRKVRGSCSHVAQDRRKRQRRAALPLTTQGNTEAGT